MLLLVSDANILIDIEEGGLLDDFFVLPYRFVTPDILFYEELDDQHAHLLELGLEIRELSPDSVLYASHLIQNYNGPSANDCFALALASQEQCPLLTGDQALRTAANREDIEIRGTIWIVEELVRHNVIGIARAHEAYHRMKDRGRRLPWEIAHEGLDTF